jgi:hypothetical protein
MGKSASTVIADGLKIIRMRREERRGKIKLLLKLESG